MGSQNSAGRVKHALDMLGLRSVTVANCKVLSREMNQLLGQSLAPITLYRMANPQKYLIKPYQYSLDLLEAFIERYTQRASRILIPEADEAFRYPNRPEDTALYKLLGLSLAASENKMLASFFESLPMEHRALGWERHIIGHGLAHFFRKSFSVKRNPILVDRLLQVPQIRTYYFETYIDYSFGLKVYGRAMEQAIATGADESVTGFRRLLEGNDHQEIASLVFGRLMLHQFAWLSNDEALQGRCEQFLKRTDLKRYLDANDKWYPYMAVRYKVALLVRQSREKAGVPVDIDAWLEYLVELFREADPGNRSFGAVILADALVLLGMRNEVQRLMNALPDDMTGYLANQPVYIRAALYRALSSESTDAQLQQIIATEYVLGEGETAYHRLMMDAALKLFKRPGLYEIELALLVAQTGFNRFFAKDTT